MAVKGMFFALFIFNGCVWQEEIAEEEEAEFFGTMSVAIPAEIQVSFEEEARMYEDSRGLPAGWADWMIANKASYINAWNRARSGKRISVSVSYENPVSYSPMWASEEEHLGLLERLAELTYPGWDFTFSSGNPEADVFAVLGYEGTSHARGDTVWLEHEGIFAHELGHILGLGHHYDGIEDLGECTHCPPGEGACLMDRTSRSFGPAERFALGLSDERHDEEVGAILDEIGSRYPF